MVDMISLMTSKISTNNLEKSQVTIYEKHGVLGGIFAVLGFLPQILVLFMFFSILEDSGYMARIAFVMDKLLRKMGLSGRSFVLRRQALGGARNMTSGTFGFLFPELLNL